MHVPMSKSDSTAVCNKLDVDEPCLGRRTPFAFGKFVHSRAILITPTLNLKFLHKSEANDGVT